MPKNVRNIVISESDKEYLSKFVNSGKHLASEIKRARVFYELSKNEDVPVEEIAKRSGVCTETVYNLLTKYKDTGEDIKSVIERKTREKPPIEPKLTGDVEARIIAMAVAPAPEGCARWTLRLLADRAVEIGIIDDVSHTSIHRLLRTNKLKPHISSYWCIPKEASAEYVAAMEDILDTYQLPRDPDVPLVCMDEKPYQLLDDAREGYPMRPGSEQKIDSEYIRKGHCSIFMFVAPHEMWRRAEVNERRTKIDWAHQVKKLVDEDFPNAKKIILCLDNLNTHVISSLYEAFPASEANRIKRKLELHYTPKHGSWLNMAECELSSLSNQCLGKRRIGDMEELSKEVLTWNLNRNASQKSINWQFTTEDARIKLRRLYPEVITS